MRPTGRLHIGHYFGALQNWVKLQNDPQYECFFFVADWHALTSDYADTSQVAQNSIEIATDYLASGLDPEKSTIFMQSLVPEHAELNLLLSMVTPLGWLERVPTYKEAFENVESKDLHTHGFLGYPVLQTADIVMYSKTGTDLVVPVGEDQRSHVELSREIVRRFNSFYGLQIDYDRWKEGNQKALIRVLYPSGEFSKAVTTTTFDMSLEKIRTVNLDILRRQAHEEGIQNFLVRVGNEAREFVHFAECLVEPSVLLTKTPRVPGTDGRKMSKSYGNFIALSQSDDTIRSKMKGMKTDPARKLRTDPGNPDICPVFDWHNLFSPSETIAWAADGCRTAGIGCAQCKTAVTDNLIKWIAPIRIRRKNYEAQPDKVLEILRAGSQKARRVAKKTMSRVREAVFGWNEIRERLVPTHVPRLETGDASFPEHFPMMTNPQLTQRQRLVFQLILDGLPSTEIASRLNVSVRTVSGIRSALRRLDANDRTIRQLGE